jgi:hypothetical protein
MLRRDVLPLGVGARIGETIDVGRLRVCALSTGAQITAAGCSLPIESHAEPRTRTEAAPRRPPGGSGACLTR